MMVAEWWDPRGGGVGAGNLGPQPYGGQQAFPGVGNRGAMIGGAAGTLASFGGLPGAGLAGAAIGTGFDVNRANNQLSSLGLDRSVAFGPSLANNMTFGLAGNTPRSQFERAVTGAYPGLLQAMSIPPAPAGQAPAWEGTPSMGFFDSINDLNNVGQLGSVLDAKGVPGGYNAYGGFDRGNANSAESGQGQGMGNERGDTGSPASAGGGGAGGSSWDGGPGSWRHGGPVGNDGDTRLEPVKGTLHEDEFVMSPEAVDMVGVKNLSMMNAMAQPRGRAVQQAMAEILKYRKTGD